MVPLYAARIEDLGIGDFVRVSCRICDHTALLTAAFLLRLGWPAHQNILELKPNMQCRACGVRGRAIVGIRWGKSVA
jgi:hypothetical protein